VDVVKVLGNGTVRGELHVTADAFTAEARELIESAGGSATLTDRAEEARAEAEDTQSGADEA
jgi:large subunit ribosomal protein L15